MERKFVAFGLFSNLQGLEIGARRAGFSTPFSTDIDEDAMRAAPFIHTITGKDTFLVKNVKSLHFKDIVGSLATIGMTIKKGEVDLLLGGPPCFGMTLLNTKHRSLLHHLNFLMLEMIRIVNEMQPKVVLIEQVPALFTKPMRPFYLLFLNALEKLGNYYWDCERLNAANYGCFQERQRAMFILVRKDIGVKPTFPNPGLIDLSRQSAFSTIGADLMRNSQFKKNIIDGHRNVFRTLTSSKVEVYRNDRWCELTLADRKVLAHMEDFDMSSILEERILVKKLGMMVLPPFAEALCRHIKNEILMKSAA